MNDDFLAFKAIQASIRGECAYCKLLTGNDSGETHSHQTGILISKSARHMLFTDEELTSQGILKKPAKILWQEEVTTDSMFTWYRSKHELRLTRIGSRLLTPKYTGALFVLVKRSSEEYSAYLLNTDSGIEKYLKAFRLTPDSINTLIDTKKRGAGFDQLSEIQHFLTGLGTSFPTPEETMREARSLVFGRGADQRDWVRQDPDSLLVDLVDAESTLLREVEQYRYGSVIREGFSSMDTFLHLANEITVRRKAQEGQPLIHGLTYLFDESRLRYSKRTVLTEEGTRYDFLFPSEEDFIDPLFPKEKLCFMSAMVISNDCWRQILKADERFSERNKFICTMQRSLSLEQLDEIQAERVTLVIPQSYIKTYPKERRDRIWTISRFIKYISGIEES